MTERQSGCFDSEMIKIRHITKNFDKIRSLDDVSAVIRQGSIFGLVGSNGAGKSTLLRIMCGIYKPDEGQVYYGEDPEEEIWENTRLKQEIVYLSDDQYFYRMQPYPIWRNFIVQYINVSTWKNIASFCLLFIWILNVSSIPFPRG